MKPKDTATVTTVVAVDPQTAFAVFTDEIDSWWKRGPRYRFDHERDGTMRFEPGVGGRLVEVHDDSAESFEVGKVLVWEPARRLVFEFRARDFAPGESTEVEVRFEAADPDHGDGHTRVTVEHRGWERLPADHAARHGLTGSAFRNLMAGWWADQLTAMAGRTAGRR